MFKDAVNGPKGTSTVNVRSLSTVATYSTRLMTPSRFVSADATKSATSSSVGGLSYCFSRSVWISAISSTPLAFRSRVAKSCPENRSTLGCSHCTHRSVYVVLILSQVVPAIVQSVCGCVGIDRPSTTQPLSELNSTTQPLSELNLNALGIENAVIFKPPPIIQLPAITIELLRIRWLLLKAKPPLASQHEAAIRRRAPHLDCCEAL